ncbi:MAG: nucleotidyltransferase family protein [Proteobacteria bacterium]|nr:nucleotidyltransferase family protein [Pseudomonadota bacterium]
MTRLDNYRSALLAVFPEISDATLSGALDAGGAHFVSFIVDHGLGPLWHARTGRAEFHASRMSAEALYLAQEHALIDIGAVLDSAGIEFVIFKGAANRLLLNENPAIRACHDIDLLVRPEDRVQTTFALVDAGFIASPAAYSISVELLLSRDVVDIDLHWRLLREGRLRSMCVAEMLGRRRENEIWMLYAEDALFVLLVHPALAKHLAGWEMGLHRVADIVAWLRSQSFDWPTVRDRLEQNGVRTAAWATLRWVEMLTHPHEPAGLDTMISELRPGRLRREWLDWWLRNDLSARLSAFHWSRLLGLSLFLHDTVGDAVRAVAGRQRARRRRTADLAAFRDLPG